jgi:hypothetical protein
MDKDRDIRKFIKTIRRALPDAAAETDDIMHKRDFDSEADAGSLWVEALADVTNMCIRRRDQDEVRKQLDFFSKQLDQGTDTVKNYIDVSYVENLMWDLAPKDKKWVWPLILENLKKLYVTMWGKPIF